MNPLSGWARSFAGCARFLRWLEETHWRFAESFVATQPETRNDWMRTSCRRLLEILHVDVTVLGPLPSRGLIVANHLSYLDVLLLGAHVPGTFVCKREVASWPLIGPLLRKADTLFVDRASRSDTARLVAALRKRASDRPVLLFPEGTTGSGERVLPFRSSLLEPWTGPREVVQPAALGYRTSRGDASQRVAYWGDASFGPHLFHLLGRRDVDARLVFGAPLATCSHRKQLASALHRAVSELHAERIQSWSGRHSGPGRTALSEDYPLCTAP